ncbi:IFRD domain-containing protein [Melanomma pulvis-pyrius CBS 109.77]|uniref:IFRD domain-containing protein n=1 Tax=Melanomma pulvis-pyrius CBS 109.77 TaxID=1314802 RepID=A0A6A6WVG6_9PLEO|nr:IFRD domain-containing protein [Melanomma pulvis-pyrius CBS 109.77]
MHDLRRQALESGKTVSRKARSKAVSTTSSKANSKAGSTLNSPAQSRANSRNPSRHGSDEEEYASDGSAWSDSAASIEDLLNHDEGDVAVHVWKTKLLEFIEQIIDRKRSSTEGRADSLRGYTHILRMIYGKDEIVHRMGDLLPAILRSIKAETNEHETVTALKALAVTIITVNSDNIYDSVASPLKRSIADSESVQTKISAIHALGTAAFFGGASEEEAEDIMGFFLEIIESDGLSINAHDEGSVVIAALEEWGLLATEIEDMEDATEAAVEAFVDQLESSDRGVQIAAGENIALLFEKSYTPREDDEELSEEGTNSDEDEPSSSVKFVKRYTVYRRQDQLMHTLDELATISTRKISKKDRKTMHLSFVDVKNSVEMPTIGPRYSMALDPVTGRPYGSRWKIRINRNVVLTINKWWKLMRLNAIRRIVQGGFVQQYEENEAVSRSLPFSMAY